MMQSQQYCDIEEQCTHFCVYKQMICPVYLRVSNPVPARNIIDTDLCICSLTEQQCKDKINQAREVLLLDIIKFRKDNSKELAIHPMWVAEAEYLESLRSTITLEKRK
jgi:hypothetical protein